MINQIDQKLIEYVQAVYLWLFDRTGVYVASIAFAFIALLTAGWLYRDYFPAWFTLLIFVIISLALSQPYQLQDKGLFDAFNMISREYQKSFFRRFAVLITGVFFVQSIVFFLVTLKTKYLGYVCTDFLLLCWLYLSCVQIRKRNPPEKKYHQLATQHTGV